MDLKKTLWQIFKFGLVGGLGTLTNLLLFYIGADRLGIEANIMTIVGFAVAVTQNYLLNHRFTFSKEMEGEPMSLRDYGKFVSVSLLGLAVNLIALNLVLFIWKDIPLQTIAQALGILAGMGVNFIGSKLFVFRKKGAE